MEPFLLIAADAINASLDCKGIDSAIFVALFITPYVVFESLNSSDSITPDKDFTALLL